MNKIIQIDIRKKILGNTNNDFFISYVFTFETILSSHWNVICSLLQSFSAILVWGFVHSSRVCTNGNVPLDVHRRLVSTQRCDCNSFSRTLSSHHLRCYRMGFACYYDCEDGKRQCGVFWLEKLLLFQAIWAVFTANSKLNQKCWFGYNLTPYYWILEGPRLIVILVSGWNRLACHDMKTNFFVAVEFHFSSEHHQSACCEASSKPHKWCWASQKSCAGGLCLVAITWNNKSPEYDTSSSRSFAFWVRNLVLCHAFPDVLSRFLHCDDLLFPQRWSKFSLYLQKKPWALQIPCHLD